LEGDENAHNYLQVLAELGIPGLVLFLAVLGFAMHEGSQPAPRLPPGLIAGFSSIC
jgi:O-antigen ligase